MNFPPRFMDMIWFQNASALPKNAKHGGYVVYIEDMQLHGGYVVYI